MKKWKKIAAVVLAMVLALAFAGMTAMAESIPEELRVYDQADLFTDEEEMELASKLLEVQKRMDMGLAIVTTEDNSSSARDYADEFYEFYEIGIGSDYSGALFLIDMENGEFWISTEGKMIRYLTDDRIDAILDDAFEYAYDGAFYQAADAFLDGVETYYQAGIESGQYNYDTETGKVSRYKSIRWYEALIALMISGVVAGGAVLAVMREYNMKDNTSKISANFKLSYRKDSKFALDNILADVLLGSYMTRTVIRNQSSSHSSGGGRSSAGRSSTHRSSSGRVHGGGGRKFK